jgi:hypothetical protein
MLAEDTLQGVPHPDHLIALPAHDPYVMLQSATFKHEATNFFIAQSNLYRQELEFVKALEATRDLLVRRMRHMGMEVPDTERATTD